MSWVGGMEGGKGGQNGGHCILVCTDYFRLSLVQDQAKERGLALDRYIYIYIYIYITPQASDRSMPPCSFLLHFWNHYIIM